MASTIPVTATRRLPVPPSVWQRVVRPAARQYSPPAIRGYAKPATPKKPIVLEKPAKFNPPSHGRRLPTKGHVPRTYGPELTSSEVSAQARKEYPTMMAPVGTWAHWFWTNKFIHTFITVGTLFALAIATFTLNFMYTSPFKDLLPRSEDFWSHPIQFLGQWITVLRLHEQDRNEKAHAAKARALDDMLKRRAFQKAHDFDLGPISRIIGTLDDDPEPDDAKPTRDEADNRTVVDAPKAIQTIQTVRTTEATEEPKRRKWLGVF